MNLAIRHLFALAAVSTLTACAPDGYTSVPAVAEYFREAAPTARYDAVSVVSLCTDSEGRPAASVLFDSGELYDYSLPEDGSPARLEYQSTAARRKLRRDEGYSVSLGCIGYYDRGDLQMTPRGDYRIEVGKIPLTAKAYVAEHLVHNIPFSEEVKLRLRRGAEAVADAVARQKKFIPLEITWGLKP